MAFALSRAYLRKFGNCSDRSAYLKIGVLAAKHPFKTLVVKDTESLMYFVSYNTTPFDFMFVN